MTIFFCQKPGSKWNFLFRPLYEYKSKNNFQKTISSSFASTAAGDTSRGEGDTTAGEGDTTAGGEGDTTAGARDGSTGTTFARGTSTTGTPAAGSGGKLSKIKILPRVVKRSRFNFIKIHQKNEIKRLEYVRKFW